MVVFIQTLNNDSFWLAIVAYQEAKSVGQQAQGETRQEKIDRVRPYLQRIVWGTVATLDGKEIRSRTMHFAVDENLNFYFATMRGDPKTKQILENPTISLLFNQERGEVAAAWECEVTGLAYMINDEAERQRAIERLLEPSPVVKNAHDGGATGIFQLFRVEPIMVKHRVFGEIIRGVPPTVVEFERSAARVEVSRSYVGWDNFIEAANLWMSAVRMPFLVATLIPVILGTVVAWARTGDFNSSYFWLALFGAACLQAGANVANDYFDHRSGNDELNQDYIRPFSGGSRMIQKGLLTPRETYAGALVFLTLGALVGLYFTWVRGWGVALLALVGLISCYFYTAPPLNLAARGLGELTVGLNFGVLMTLGAYFVQTGTWSVEAAVVSLPVALLITAILWINQFPDHDADRAVGKRHWVVRMGKERAVSMFSALMLSVPVIVVAASLLGGMSLFALISLASIPALLQAIRIARKHYDNSVYLAPANARTVLAHLATGLLLAAGYALERLV